MRIRLTVRRMMILVAILAVGLLAWVEFREGVPPRFVLNRIPDRVAKLRPGMTYQETAEILGLEKSWLQGGTSAWFYYGSGGRNHMEWVYAFRYEQITPEAAAKMQAESPGLVPHIEPKARIYLGFVMDLKPDEQDWKHSPSTRLDSARYVVDGKSVNMPR